MLNGQEWSRGSLGEGQLAPLGRVRALVVYKRCSVDLVEAQHLPVGPCTLLQWTC